MGLARIVEIDTTGGPGFGFEHFKQYDFLRDKEVVLTFDDGPWPGSTPAVLKALADECLKATFFEIGEHATWHPEITKQVVAAGMTVGTHTWSHKDLARNPYAKDIEQAKQEIEMGISAVHMAAPAVKSRRSSASLICSIPLNFCRIWRSAISQYFPPTSTRATLRCTNPNR
jgi:peptidoglycan/xylan/chitin deacetylase (PgdA/CDA1 family)